MWTNIIKKYPFSSFTLLTVCVLSLMPFPEIKAVEDIPLADKWTHFVMYGGLTAVMWVEVGWRTQNCSAQKWPWRLLGLITLALFALGGILELLQEYATTTRSGEWWDWVADNIGVLLGTGIGSLSSLLKKRKFS